MPVVFQRFKNAKITLDQMIVRYTKNHMAEKAYFENIKSRKFQNLTDEGSLGKIWLEIKDFVGVIESNSNELVVKFKDYVDQTTKDFKDYEIATKQIETEYGLIKKRKDTAILDVNKKREKYVAVFKEWDEAEGQATQARNEVGASNPKTLKLQKLVADKFSQKETTEAQYIESVKCAQGFEKDYDTKLADLLRRFEVLELQRLTGIQLRLQEFFTLWHENSVKYTEILQKCVIAVSNINPREDLVAFSNQYQTDNPHMPYQLATLCQRTHGPDVPSANHALPYVAGSPTAASTSTPLVVTRGQELQQSKRPLSSSSPTNTSSRLQQPQPPVPQKSLMQTPTQPQTHQATATTAVGIGAGADALKQKQPQQQQAAAASKEGGSIVVGTNEFVVAKVLVAYQGTSETETNVNVGETVMVIPDKHGQGWVYCLKQDGQGGYIPSDYVEITQ